MPVVWSAVYIKTRCNTWPNCCTLALQGNTSTTMPGRLAVSERRGFGQRQSSSALWGQVLGSLGGMAEQGSAMW